MKRITIYFYLLLAISINAQNLTTGKYDEMIWLGYYNTINVNDKWNIVTDAQIRTKDWIKHWSQGLLRTGLSRNLNEKFTLTAGIAHFRYFINDQTTRGEWRPWEELAIHDNWKKWKITHRIRAEQRFNENVVNDEPNDKYVFNHRFRYRLDFQRSIWQKNQKQLWLSFGNELMVNAGKNIKINYFDQNRSYGGLIYDLTKSFSVQAQFMYIWQQLSNGIIDKISVIRFNIIHRLNFRNGNKSTK